MIFVGVDGCPAGWIAVVWGKSLSHHLCHDFSEVLALKAEIIAVDMPIGFAENGIRSAEREARLVLGQRKSSLFAMPCRAAIACKDYREACSVNFAHTDPPKKISKQAFYLFDKIRQIDHVITPATQSLVHECHPEVAFWAMNNQCPLLLPKKINGRPYGPGLEMRRQLLRNAGFPLDQLPKANYAVSKVAPDDLLDACACAWSARRIAEGQDIRFPKHIERDAKGLAMAIKA